MFIPLHPTVPASLRALGSMGNISKYLETYYENIDKSGEDVRNSDVVKFFENESQHISSQKPETLSIYNYGVYLCLTHELKSEAPIIIAYTTPLDNGRNGFSRLTLFLYKNHITIIVMDNDAFLKILGGDEKVAPDCYYSLSKIRKE